MRFTDGPVLLVDDHDDTRALLVELLSLIGFRVVPARDGAEARAELRSGLQPCIVLLDLLLPDVSGVELCRELRSLPDLASTPIYAMTGYYHLAAEALRAGCDGTLLKPVRPPELRGLLAEHCAARLHVA